MSGAVDTLESAGTESVIADASSAERQAFAWSRLKEWAPRQRVIEEMIARFGISKSQAYYDIAAIYEEMAESRRMSRKAEAEALLVQIDDEIDKLRTADSPIGRAPVSSALARLWDQKAKLTGAYRDTTRIAVLVASAKEITGLSDDALNAAIDGAQSQLALPPGPTVEAQASEERPMASAPPPEPAPVAAAPARRRSRKRGRGKTPPG